MADAAYYRERNRRRSDFEIPPVTKKAKAEREKCRNDLKRFAEEVFANVIYHGWSENHLIYLRYLQDIFTKGGRQAVAMPRGSGKTSLAVIAILWAMLYKHRRYTVVVASTSQLAEQFIKRIKVFLETNDRLLEWFPGDIVPFRKLEGVSLRAKTQHYKDKLTYIGYSNHEIIFPFIDEAEAKGAVIQAFGITGSIRGLQHATPDGDIRRPDAVLIDDPQTKDSARSVGQTKYRSSVIDQDIGMLGGPGETISMLMTCTVIEPGDLADKYLNRRIRPEWRGYRTKALNSFPKNLKLWKKYYDILVEEMVNEEDNTRSTQFYKDHFDAMHEGAQVAWEGYKREEHIDALQTLMIEYLQDKHRFFAEYQNEPIRENVETVSVTEAKVRRQLNGIPHVAIPENTAFVTMAADINYYGIHWAKMAIDRQYAGYITDYGRYPDQANLWTKDSTKTSKQAIYDGIVEIARLASSMKRVPDILLIDCGFEMETVFAACAFASRQYPVRVLPSRGRANNQYKVRNPIGLVGDGVYLANFEGKGRVVVINVDIWKFRTLQGFMQRPGAPASVSLYGDVEKDHFPIARHIAAERLVDHYTRNGEEKFEWRVMPGARNDWFDAVTAAFAAGSLFGLAVGGGVVKAEQAKVTRVREARYSSL